MRLSMWMLADWLVDYEPEVKIQDGSRTLRNVRLLADASTYLRTTVYLEQADSGSIICSNGNDIIVLHTDDIDQVFNRVLDAFDHYNEWQAQLYDMVRDGCTTRELLKAGKSELGGFFVVADATYLIRDYVGDEALPPSAQGPAGQILERGLMPIETVLRINQMPGVRSAQTATYRVALPELGAVSSVNNLHVHGEHVGWFVVTQEGGCTQGEMDVQEAFSLIVAAQLERESEGAERRTRSSVFNSILSDEDIDRAQTLLRVDSLGWSRDDALRVLVVRQVDAMKNPNHVVGRFIERLGPAVSVLQHAGDTLCVVNETMAAYTGIMDEIAGVLQACGCAAGMSPRFSDVFELRAQYLAAKVAAKADAPASQTIVDFEDCKFDYALSLIRANAVADVRHAAVRLLANHDLAHGTELGGTLRTYLLCNCNATEAARKLFVHRSTLLYRLERIAQITGIDLDDEQERAHLTLSYLLDAS